MNPRQVIDSFPFFDLPPELRFKIMEFVDVKTYATLLRTGKTMKSLCDRGPWWFYRKINSIHQFHNRFEIGYVSPDVRYFYNRQKHAKLYAEVLFLEDLMDNLRLYACAQFCGNEGMRCNIIATASDLQCSGESFALLFERLQAKQWNASQFAPKRLLPHLDIEMMFLLSTDCDDDTLLQMKPPIIHMVDAPGITDRGLNLYIKQWLRGERKLVTIDINWDLSQRNLDVLLEGLPLNPIWTPDWHEHSLLGHLPLEEIQQQLQTEGMDQLYTLYSHRNISDYRILSIGRAYLKLDLNPLTEAELLQRTAEQVAP